MPRKAWKPGWLPNLTGQRGRGGGEAGDVARGQAGPTSANYSSVTMDDFLSVSFLICKRLFTLAGAWRAEIL